MRRARILRIEFAIAIFGVSCGGVVPLEVGSVAGDEDAGASNANSFSLTRPPLSQRFEDKCSAAPGTADYYNSAAELSDRLRGRWYHCTNLGNYWALPPGAALDFEFGDGGTYQFLTVDDARYRIDVSTIGADQNGALRYLVFNGMESSGGGDGGSGGTEGGSTELFIPWNDTSARNDINLYFARTVDNFEFVVAFEQNPRRLELRELGATPALGIFVPIEEGE